LNIEESFAGGSSFVSLTKLDNSSTTIIKGDTTRSKFNFLKINHILFRKVLVHFL